MVAQHERKRVVRIPLVVGIAVVRLEPRAVLVPLDVEQLRVAVAVGQRAWSAIQNTTLRPFGKRKSLD